MLTVKNVGIEDRALRIIVGLALTRIMHLAQLRAV